MAKPIIKTITPFDASSSYRVNFIWTGNMAYTNRIIIYDADTMLAMYDNTYEPVHSLLYHDIPAGVLLNSRKYAVVISVTDVVGVVSEFSDKYYFWCMKSPSFYFENLDATGQNYIYNSVYEATLHYSQDDDVPLSKFRFFLYDSTKELLDKSDEITYSDEDSLRYTFRSLETNTVYYIRASGYNARNVPVDTGDVLLIVTYENPSLYATFYANVNKTIGVVDYYSNIVDIESDRPSEEYTFENSYIDLTGSDPNKVMIITESNSLYPDMEVTWISLSGEILTGHVLDGPTFEIHDYKEVKQITLSGESVLTSKPEISLNNYRKGRYVYVDRCNLTIDGTLITNILDSYPLRRLLSNNICDSVTIMQNGNRVLHRRIEETVINERTVPLSTGVTRNNYGRDMFTIYYDVGTTCIYGTENLMCDALPTTGDTSRVEIMPDNTLAIMWDYTELPVTDYVSAMQWLALHPVLVLFPLAEPMTIYLSNVTLPKLANVNSVRYSKNFVIPADNATFSIRMVECFKTCEVLRVQTEGVDVFVVDSIIYDDYYLRYKLTVFGPTSNYIIYSEPLQFRNWENDIVTLHVRRINGIYDMYVFVTIEEPDPDRNIWFMISDPPEYMTQNTDLWLDLDYPIPYIDKTHVVRIYQPNEPMGLSVQSIWIGD